jgi:hypothetical protein
MPTDMLCATPTYHQEFTGRVGELSEREQGPCEATLSREIASRAPRSGQPWPRDHRSPLSIRPFRTGRPPRLLLLEVLIITLTLLRGRNDNQRWLGQSQMESLMRWASRAPIIRFLLRSDISRTKPNRRSEGVAVPCKPVSLGPASTVHESGAWVEPCGPRRRGARARKRNFLITRRSCCDGVDCSPEPFGTAAI